MGAFFSPSKWICEAYKGTNSHSHWVTNGIHVNSVLLADRRWCYAFWCRPVKPQVMKNSATVEKNNSLLFFSTFAADQRLTWSIGWRCRSPRTRCWTLDWMKTCLRPHRHAPVCHFSFFGALDAQIVHPNCEKGKATRMSNVNRAVQENI